MRDDDADLRRILRETRSIAAVGVSLNELRPSFFVARYLALKGYKMIPVNPGYAGRAGFGATVLASLSEIEAGPVEMVDVFRRSDQAGAVVDEALDTLLEKGLRTIWMQIGVEDAQAAARAEAKGVAVIMNRCPKIEYQRLFGELRMGGFNTGVIGSKRPPLRHRWSGAAAAFVHPEGKAARGQKRQNGCGGFRGPGPA